MIIYLAPTLLVCCLLAAAVQLRRRIEPACPSCASRSWSMSPVLMACAACGWSTAPQGESSPERQAA